MSPSFAMAAMDTCLRTLDTPFMESARKIATDGEIRAIAVRGVGFVVDPFNRRWHTATCPRVQRMTVGQPKWFAGTPAALDVCLRQRLLRFPTAKAILACTTCGGSAGMSHGAPRSPSPPRRSTATGAQPGAPLVRRAVDGFEVWAGEYVRNESRAASPAGALRRLITSEVRALPAPAGRVLHAGYAGQRWRGTDVENLLFNNIDQTLSVFSAPGSLGVRFEDLGLTVPDAPDGTSRRSFYCYRLVVPGQPFAACQAGRLICRVPEVTVPDGPARLAARIWFAVGRARPPCGPAAWLWRGDFLLKITVRALEPAANLKAIVDGATAAMQRDEPDRVGGAMTRLSGLLGAGAEELLALVTAGDAPLGSRSRSSPASKESLFTLDGPAQVRVTPDDDRCAAAEVVASGTSRSARLAVAVYAVEHRRPVPGREP